MIGYTVSIEGLAEMEMDLEMSRDKTKTILRHAINNTAKKVEKQMFTEAGKRYALKEGKQGYHRVNKIEKAKGNRIYATITAASRPADTYKFMVQPPTYFPGSKGAPNWIKAKTLKKGGHLTGMALMKSGGVLKGKKKKGRTRHRDLYKAFVVKYHNVSNAGAISDHTALAERIPGSHMKNNPHKEALRSLYSTTQAKGEEVVYKEKIDGTVYATLSEQMRLAVQKFVK